MMAFVNGDGVEIFLEGAATIAAFFGAIVVPLVVLSVLKKHTKV